MSPNKSKANAPDLAEPPKAAIEYPPRTIKVNYYRLLEWFWNEVPFMTGYKSHYGCAFLAIVDSINRNSQKEMWRETAIDFVQLINKVSCSKPMYYEALRWLKDHHLINYTKGLNANAAARFHLGAFTIAEVNKLTSANTSTAVLLSVEVNKLTSDSTSTSPVEVNKLNSGLPLYIDIPNTNNIPNTNTHVVPTFDVFWDLYDHKYRRKECEKKWGQLSDKDKLAIMAVLPAYVLSTPEGGVPSRQYPLTFLNNESWKDEDIGKSRAPTTGPNPTRQSATDRPQTQTPKGLARLNQS